MENMTRQELLNFIKTKEAELDELRTASTNGEPVDFGKMNRIEVEIDDAEKELEKISELEGEYDSGSDLENAQQQHEEQEKEVGKTQVQEIRETQIEEEQKQNKGEFTLTLTDWQKKTGIEIIPDEYLRQRHDKYLTEEEFKGILANENVPKIIQEPGKAEMYLKTPADWDGVRTSMSSLEEAIRNGNFPADVNDQSYILLQYNKDKVMDGHDDILEDGYGKIDEDDIHGISENDDSRETVEEEERLEEEANRQDGSGVLWNKIKIGLKNGMKIVLAKEVLNTAREIGIIAGTVSAKVVPLALGAIEKGTEAGWEAMKQTAQDLSDIFKDPDPLKTYEDKQKQEKENEGQEPQPGMPRKPIS